MDLGAPRIANIGIYKASNGYSFKNNSTFNNTSKFNNLPSYDLYFKHNSRLLQDIKIDFYSSSKFIPIQVSASFTVNDPTAPIQTNTLRQESLGYTGIEPDPINTEILSSINEDLTLAPLTNRITLKIQDFDNLNPIEVKGVNVIKLSFFPSFDSYNKALLEGSSEFGEIGIHNISFGKRTATDGSLSGSWADDEQTLDLRPLIDVTSETSFSRIIGGLSGGSTEDFSRGSTEDSSEDSSSESSGDSTTSSGGGGGY